MSQIPETVALLLESVDEIYDYEKDSDWIGNCEVDYAWDLGGNNTTPMFSVFFTDEGYGLRGDKPKDITEGEAVVATILVFELAGVDYELPKSLSSHTSNLTP